MTAKHWNAGDVGCGALVMGLKQQLDQVGAGELLRVTARNDGAPLDLPSWCRVTGNELIVANHPNYILRKKAN